MESEVVTVGVSDSAGLDTGRCYISLRVYRCYLIELDPFFILTRELLSGPSFLALYSQPFTWPSMGMHVSAGLSCRENALIFTSR